jgi:hypothetical protein
MKSTESDHYLHYLNEWFFEGTIHADYIYYSRNTNRAGAVLPLRPDLLRSGHYLNHLKCRPCGLIPSRAVQTGLGAEKEAQNT